MFYYCCCNYDFSWEDDHNAEHIESIWLPAGVNCVDEVRGDYCHKEALVIITLVTELISCAPDVQAAASPSCRRLNTTCNTQMSLMCLKCAYATTDETELNTVVAPFIHTIVFTYSNYMKDQQRDFHPEALCYGPCCCTLLLVCATGHHPVMTGDGAHVNSHLHTSSGFQPSTHTFLQLSSNNIPSHSAELL